MNIFIILNGKQVEFCLNVIPRIGEQVSLTEGVAEVIMVRYYLTGVKVIVRLM